MTLWTTYLVLAPDSVDLGGFGPSTPKQFGLARDILSGPPPYLVEDLTDPENPVDVEVQPTTWPNGYHSPVPPLLFAVANSGSGGRFGARFYFASLPGSGAAWIAYQAQLSAGLALAQETGLWGTPDACLVLDAQTPEVEAMLGAIAPGVGVAWASGPVTPGACVAALAVAGG